MTPQENLFSPTAPFWCFIISVWQYISLKRDISWSWSLSKISSQCHSNTVLVPLYKTPDPVKDLYDAHTYDLKKGGYMNEYGCGSSGLWNIFLDFSFGDMVISVYYCG